MSASKRPLLRFALLVATLVLVACRAPEGAERAVQRVSITTNYALASGATLERVGPDALEVGAASSLDAAFVQGYATARFQLDELLAARSQSRGRARIGAGLDDRFVAALDLRAQATAAFFSISRSSLMRRFSRRCEAGVANSSVESGLCKSLADSKQFPETASPIARTRAACTMLIPGVV